ncbi:MAG: FtsH protease activity modulator HflK [Thermodesulfobacteriota bacterium]
MTWDNQQPPWGRKPPPRNLEELIVAIIDAIKKAFAEKPAPPGAAPPREEGILGRLPGQGLGRLASALGILLVLIGLFSSFYTIAPGQRGVVLRFGKHTSLASPGLNLKLPFIDEVIKVDVESVRKEEFGFRTLLPGERTQYQKSGFKEESLMLTSDRNVIDLEWIIQYKVDDPVLFCFQIKNSKQAVRDVTEMALRRIVGNMTFDYLLGNREILAAATQREVQAILDGFKSGVKIVTVQLQDVNPPEQVKPAFNEVNEADQDMKRLVNEAEEAYNREVPKAHGSAKKTLEQAHGYAVERVNLARGETARFLSVLKEYKGAPEVTRRRLYLETMQQVLPGVTDIYVLDESQRGILPFLNMTGAHPARPATTASDRGNQ